MYSIIEVSPSSIGDFKLDLSFALWTCAQDLCRHQASTTYLGGLQVWGTALEEGMMDLGGLMTWTMMQLETVRGLWYSSTVVVLGTPGAGAALGDNPGHPGT